MDLIWALFLYLGVVVASFALAVTIVVLLFWALYKMWVRQ